jgi:tetratricopeptide (TPR) repeat protein
MTVYRAGYRSIAGADYGARPRSLDHATAVAPRTSDNRSRQPAHRDEDLRTADERAYGASSTSSRRAATATAATNGKADRSVVDIRRTPDARTPAARDRRALDGFRRRVDRARSRTGKGSSLLPSEHDLRVLPGNRKRHPLMALLESLLVLAGLTAMGLTALADRVAAHPRYQSLARYRLAAAGLAACCVFLLSGVSVYAVVLPQVGVHAPGQNILHRMLDRVPNPWRPERPAHVALPEGMSARQAAPTVNYPPSALTPSQGIGPGRAVPVATIGEVPPSATSSDVASNLPPLPPLARLDRVSHQWQTWNNCGPATMTMAASVFGREQDQTAAMNFMKTTPNDKNVRPDEMVNYARSLGLQADWRVGGDVTRLKHFLANGIPVIVEVSYDPDPNDWMGHYRLLVGYDDTAGRFVAYDSVIPPGTNLPQPYGKFDDEWQIFNRTYIPVYPPEKAETVNRILGRDRDDKAMFEHALEVAQAEVAARPESGYAWFNLGTSLVSLGRTGDAVTAYDRARTLKLPWRMLWYQFGPFEAYLAEGRIADVQTLADANLAQSKDLEESHYFRGRALQAKGQIDAARAAYQAALRANGRFAPASDALKSLG